MVGFRGHHSIEYCVDLHCIERSVWVLVMSGNLQAKLRSTTSDARALTLISNS